MKIQNIGSAFVYMAALAHGKPIEKRGTDDTDVNVTEIQQWCVAGGALLGGIGMLAGGIGQFMTGVNSRHTCNPQVGVVHDRKRAAISVHHRITEHMQFSGYQVIDRSFLYEPELASYGSNLVHLSNGPTDVIIGNSTGGGVIATFGVREPLLHERTPTVYRIQLHYDVYSPNWGSGVPCHTTATTSDFDATAKIILDQISRQRCGVSCYSEYHGNDWHGSLRIGQYIPATGEYHDTSRTCNNFGG